MTALAVDIFPFSNSSMFVLPKRRHTEAGQSRNRDNGCGIFTPHKASRCCVQRYDRTQSSKKAQILFSHTWPISVFRNNYMNGFCFQRYERTLFSIIRAEREHKNRNIRTRWLFLFGLICPYLHKNICLNIFIMLFNKRTCAWMFLWYHLALLVA